ncbi:unnamed protein product [Owenia fusiformis]|uniref:Uncharacterized protein n=1 Tax=Owenia fusiformis TaxID=6347 RepID=A0A8S4P575_OWEFU|nr:unnamed protein product [Owenia fusiformis]
MIHGRVIHPQCYFSPRHKILPANDGSNSGVKLQNSDVVITLGRGPRALDPVIAPYSTKTKGCRRISVQFQTQLLWQEHALPVIVSREISPDDQALHGLICYLDFVMQLAHLT